MASKIAFGHRVWPLHGGETGALIRTRDWSATPLGDARQWPERFRAAVDTCLDAAFASFVWWGPDLIQLYNDAALPIMQARHPAAFGVPASAVWPDAWPIVGPIVDRVMSTGRPEVAVGRPLTKSDDPGFEAASISFSCSALRNASGDAAGVFVTAFGAAEAVRAESAPRYPALLEAVDGHLSAPFDAMHNEPLEEVLEADNLASWANLIAKEDRETALADVARTRSDPSVIYKYAVRPPGGESRWVSTTDLSLVNDTTHFMRSGAMSLGATSEPAAAERTATMVAEMQHRTRNLIAVVRAIVSRTLATSPDPDDFWRRIDDRLRALSRVQGLLSRSEQEPITIGALVRLEFDEDNVAGRGLQWERVAIAGPVVRLGSSIVQTLALALHELASNARNYGALSTGDGRLRIAWRLEERDNGSWLVLDWVEEHVRRTGARPSRQGYGREFIEHALSYSHGAETRYELDDTGLWCSIALPLGAQASGER